MIPSVTPCRKILCTPTTLEENTMGEEGEGMGSVGALQIGLQGLGFRV